MSLYILQDFNCCSQVSWLAEQPFKVSIGNTAANSGLTFFDQHHGTIQFLDIELPKLGVVGACKKDSE